MTDKELADLQAHAMRGRPIDNSKEARLYRAAPALLEACKELIAWEAHMGGWEAACWNEARAAISQAEGTL